MDGELRARIGARRDERDAVAAGAPPRSRFHGKTRCRFHGKTRALEPWLPSTGARAHLCRRRARRGARRAARVVYLLGGLDDDAAVTRPGQGRRGRAGRVRSTRHRRRCARGTASIRERIYAARSPGVVTVYVYFGGEPDADHAAQGSGFVVSPDGYVLTSAHVITTAGQGDRRTPAGQAGLRRLQRRRPRQGRRSSATTSSTMSASSVSSPLRTRCGPIPLGNSSTLRVGAIRSRRSAARSATRLARGRRRLGGRALDPVADLAVLPLRRDPDRRADHPRELRRPAARCPRRRGRHQRADPHGQRERRGRRLRRPDQRGASARCAQLIAAGRVRYPYVGITTTT